MLILSLLFLTVVEASPPLLEGGYRFAGEIVPAQKQLIETVHSSESQRLKDLRADEYSCVLKLGSWYQCKKFVEPFFEKDIVERFLEDYSGTHRLRFEPEHASPEKLFEGTDYEEWQIYQAVELDETREDQLIYRRFKQTEKINFGPSLILDEGSIRAPKGPEH